MEKLTPKSHIENVEQLRHQVESVLAFEDGSTQQQSTQQFGGQVPQSLQRNLIQALNNYEIWASNNSSQPILEKAFSQTTTRGAGSKG